MAGSQLGCVTTSKGAHVWLSCGAKCYTYAQGLCARTRARYPAQEILRAYARKVWFPAKVHRMPLRAYARKVPAKCRCTCAHTRCCVARPGANARCLPAQTNSHCLCHGTRTPFLYIHVALSEGVVHHEGFLASPGLGVPDRAFCSHLSEVPHSPSGTRALHPVNPFFAHRLTLLNPLSESQTQEHESFCRLKT